jgi:hypothetical protein
MKRVLVTGAPAYGSPIIRSFGRCEMWPLPDNLYIRQLLDSRGQDEAVVYREVKQAILTLRFWRAVEPWIALFRPAARFIRHVWKEKIYGR